MMDYDVSMHIQVELVVTIPTSRKSSKTESGWKSYCSFRCAVSVSFQALGISDSGLTGISGSRSFSRKSGTGRSRKFSSEISLSGGISGLKSGSNGYNFWGGINTPPLLLPLDNQGSTNFPSLLLHCWPWKAWFLSIPPLILAYSLGKVERRSRSTILPIHLSSKWGEPSGSRSWSSFVVLLLCSSSLLPP